MVEHGNGEERPGREPFAAYPQMLARRATTDARLRLLRGVLSGLPEQDRDYQSKCCAFVSGSVARWETGPHSDVDVFIIDELALGTDSADEASLRFTERLTRVETARLLTQIDEARQGAGFRPFSGGGRFLDVHSLKNIISSVGQPNDDATNRLTTRMLLLCNSQPLVNEEAHDEAWRRLVNHYWRGCADPDQPYLPIHLFNDLRRFWHTLCLNFESKHPTQQIEGMPVSSPSRRLGNLKLRTSRLLTCYTPLAGMLAASAQAGVARHNAERVLKSTPLERLAMIKADGDTALADLVDGILDGYEKHLELTADDEDTILAKLRVDDAYRQHKRGAAALGNSMADLLLHVGAGKELYRYTLI